MSRVRDRVSVTAKFKIIIMVIVASTPHPL